MRAKDLKGQKFNKWTVLERAENPGKGTDAYWLCRCECGTEKAIMGRTLRKGQSKSCGCHRESLHRNKDKAFLGKKYGRLNPYAREVIKGIAFWHCNCDCGNKTKKRRKDIVNGKAASCGCLRKEITANRFKRDHTGERFGRLTAVKYLGKINSVYYYDCVCACGNTKRIRRENLVNGNTKSCGCLYEERTGEDNPNWNPDLTNSEREAHRYTPEYKAFIKEAMERDDYTCQACTTKGGTMHVHHKDDYANNKEKRTDVDNGVTLCEDCHREYHTLYGYAKATIDEYNQWIEAKKED